MFLDDTLVRGNIVLSELCHNIGDDWETLAQALGVSQQDIQLITNEADTSTDRADLALKIWRKSQADSATGNSFLCNSISLHFYY